MKIWLILSFVFFLSACSLLESEEEESTQVTPPVTETYSVDKDPVFGRQRGSSATLPDDVGELPIKKKSR